MLQRGEQISQSTHEFLTETKAFGQLATEPNCLETLAECLQFAI